MDMMNLRRGLMMQMAGSEFMKKVGTHVLQNDFSSGNGTDLVQIVMNDSYLSSKALVYVLRFSNNTYTSNYKVNEIVFGSSSTTVSGLSLAPGYCFRGDHSISNGVGSTIRASAGTVVDIYRADWE